MRSMRLSILAAAMLLAASCSDSTGPEDVWGAYALTSLRNDLLPARVSCGGYNVVYGVLALGRTRNSATYHLRLEPLVAGDAIAFNAAGIYRVDGDALILTVEGGWSHRSGNERMRFEFEIVDDGTLARRNVGAECDANDTEIYQRAGIELLTPR